jgi:hypothetical protein
MSDVAKTLTAEIRSAETPARGRGHSVPSTGATSPALANQGDRAVRLPGRQTDFPAEGMGGPARRDAANHFGWKLQAGMEIRSYAETIAVRTVNAGDVLLIDPAMATIWRVNAAGSFSISVADLQNMTVAGEPASRVLSLVLYIQRASGVVITWPIGTLWGADVRDPDGDGDPADSPLAAPDAARMDVFVLNLVPSIGWIGYIAATDLGVI